jgi:hypothetical protein
MDYKNSRPGRVSIKYWHYQDKIKWQQVNYPFIETLLGSIFSVHILHNNNWKVRINAKNFLFDILKRFVCFSNCL